MISCDEEKLVLNSARRHLVALIIPAILSMGIGLRLTEAISAGAGPRAQMGEAAFDFGEVFEDKELSHTFFIKNTGDAPLEITSIDPDCACTAADYDRIIPPGGQGRLKLTVAPYSVLRKFTKETKVFFNDPTRPAVVFALKGYGKPVIDIQPSHVIRLRGKAGEDIQGRVRIVSNLPAPLEITGHTTTIPHLIEISLKAEQSGKVYTLEVRDKSRAKGTYKGAIELATTSKDKPHLMVRVFGEID
jgi:hypothetical protein